MCVGVCVCLNELTSGFHLGVYSVSEGKLPRFGG